MGRTLPLLGDRGHTPEARVLLASLHLDRNRLEDSGIEHLSVAQWNELVTLAGYQRVRPLLHQRLFSSGHWRHAPEGAWQRLDHECRAIAMRLMRMHGELSIILRTLSEAGIPTIVLKGACLGPVVYRNIALREMMDLDIMVPRERMKHAAEQLLGLAYQELDPFPVDWNVIFSHHVTVTKSGASVIELHWTTPPPDQITSMDPGRLWQSAIPMNTNGTDTFCLSPGNQLLHLCLHASFQHQFEFGLRPSCDIAHVIAHYGAELDWDDILRTSEQGGWSRGVLLALGLARDLIGANLPLAVTRALAPSQLGPGLTIAHELVWTTPLETAAFAAGLTELSPDLSWHARLGALRRRIFLPKRELRATSATPSGDWWWLLYGRRLSYLLRQHTGTAIRLLAGRDRTMNELAKRRNHMRTWLSQKEPAPRIR
jgi:hypothetical protein